MTDTLHPLAQPDPSSVIAERYALREHLGSGGMADVFSAWDERLGREVAVKLYRNVAANPIENEQADRELRLLAELRHPGLIEVFDAGTVRVEGVERDYLVMELIDTPSFRGVLTESSGVAARQVAEIGCQVADALAYVHSRGIVHRDVTPGNILVAETPAFGFRNLVKLADFGIARSVHTMHREDDGPVFGTAAYLSPEQVLGEPVGTASDVFSLGLVLIEAFSGERQYHGTPVEAALARLHRPPVVPEGLPEGWDALLRSMTARESDQRPTAHDVAVTLRELWLRDASHSRHAGRASARRAGRDDRPNHRGGRAAALVVLGLAVASLAAAFALSSAPFGS
ncbi:MAG: serine/threonine-protein kinase [Microbacteriaceae bacterium]